MSIQTRSRAAVVFVLCAVVMTGVAMRVSAEPASSTRIIATSGDAVPEGNGSFLYTGGAVLNNAGQVAFAGGLTGTSGGFGDDTGLYRSDGTGGIINVARAGEPLPGGDTFLVLVDFPFDLSNDGTVSFLVGYQTPDGFSRGIFQGDGTSVPTKLLAIGDPAADGNGFIADIRNAASNDSGQVAYGAVLTGTTGGFADDIGLFAVGGPAGSRQFVREGDAAPDGNGFITGIDGYAPINNAGQIAFHAYLSGSGRNTRAIYLSDGRTGLVRVARGNQTAPDGNGRFQGFEQPVLNNAGQVAFYAFISNSGGGPSGSSGIFRGDGVTGPIRVVRRNDPAPDGNGIFAEVSKTPSLNGAGQVAFTSSLANTAGGKADDKGLFLFDDSDGITQIAREGQAAPDDNGQFVSFSDYALNDAGQIAFTAALGGTSGGSVDDYGIFLFDPTEGLHEVVREGDTMLGGTIEYVDLVTSIYGYFGQWSNGFNDLGQIAYSFGLADGRSGIALWGLADPDRLVGDFDGDGEVGQGDLNLVLDFWGDAAVAGVSPDSAWLDPTDITGTLIGQDELAIVLKNWGNTAALASRLDEIAAATGLGEDDIRGLIPEPGTAALMLVVLPMWLRRRRA